MKKIALFVFIFVLSLAFQKLYSQIISEKTARIAAANYMKLINAEKQISPNQLFSIPIKNTSKNNPEIFIFNSENDGFVIISGDKSATPIIGYSYTGSIPTTKWNPNFEEWINNSINQIKSYRQAKTVATQDIADKWDYLLNNLKGESPFKRSKAVQPLLKSAWGQSGYYNALCPTNEKGRAVVGCVATAMAQIMYYHRYPKTGLGEHSYDSYNYGELYVNFGNATYNYDEMYYMLKHPSYETAELSYHCGVSVEMNYSPDGSGAYSHNVPNALINNFRYADAQYKARWEYDDETWTNMLKSNLDAKLPLYYSGNDGITGGHAFIIDGYENTSYYHLDWGWNESGNGYFHIDNLNPLGSDFTHYHQCVEHIIPPTNAYSGCSGLTTLTNNSGSISDGSGPIKNYSANSNCSWLVKPIDVCNEYNITFRDFSLGSGDTLYLYSGENTSAPLIGKYFGSNLPQNVLVYTSYFFLNFISNSSIENNGFLLDFVGNNSPKCNGIKYLKNQADTFNDGSGDGNYGSNSFCKWIIEPTGAIKIDLNFTLIDLADTNDYIKVYDNTNNVVLKEFRKGDAPENFSVNSKKITITFKTDDKLSADGFEANYSSVLSNIDENENNHIVSIYPNPANNLINIDLNEFNSNAIIVIYDYSGKCVYKSSVSDNKLTIPTDNFNSGIYQIGLISNDETFWKKIIIQH